MGEPIPVNPIMLRWARETLGMPVEDVAHRMKKDVRDIEAWERGETAPTYVQLETLAYKVYRRPLALFFFPEPPKEERIERSFRTLPIDVIDQIPARIRYLIRKAQVLQMNLIELYDGVNPAERHILKDLSFTRNQNAVDVAAHVRAYLGVTPEQQRLSTDEDDAFKFWRAILEDHGVFVFKDSFNPPGKKRTDYDDSRYSGFCIYDDTFPVIYVNNNHAKTRQIFTLFHELGHLLMHTGGIDTRHDEYLDQLTGENRRIEVFCNQFAAEFLVPSSDFSRYLEHFQFDDRSISQLAVRYWVSREVILRRLRDRNMISDYTYQMKVSEWASRAKEGPKKSRGGDHYLNKGVYLGERYIERVLSHYHQDRITLEQAAEYLGEKPANIPRIEDWLFEREAAG